MREIDEQHLGLSVVNFQAGGLHKTVQQGLEKNQLSRIGLRDQKSVVGVLYYREVLYGLWDGRSQLLNGCSLVDKYIYSSSAARTKRRGDRGSPWRTPLLHLKNFPGTPFNRIADDPEERTALTQFSHLSVKPMCCMTWMIDECSTVSKAFLKSNFKMIISLLD
jgi:hypothetical protein